MRIFNAEKDSEGDSVIEQLLVASTTGVVLEASEPFMASDVSRDDKLESRLLDDTEVEFLRGSGKDEVRRMLWGMQYAVINYIPKC